MKFSHDFRGGKHIRIGSRLAGIWPDNIDPQKSEFKDIFEVIDPEWVTSAPNILRDLAERVTAIRADAKLSDIGKRQAIQEASRSALNRLKTKTAKVDRLQDALIDGMETAIKVPTPSLNDTMIDLAMAAYLRDQVKSWQGEDFAGPDRIASRLQSLSERARLAVIRVPAELSGVDVHIQDTVRTTFVDPAVAKHLEDKSYAIDVARKVVQVVLDEIVTLSKLPQSEVQEVIGQGWDTSGVTFSRKPADLSLMPNPRGDRAALAAQRASDDAGTWAEGERQAGREVTEEQQLAKRDQLAQQYLVDMPAPRELTGRENLKDAKNEDERRAIIRARLAAGEKAEA